MEIIKEKCRVCHSDSTQILSKKILNKYDISYYKCDKCGYLQTESPYWINEVYNSTLPKTDEGLLRRNLYISEKIEKIIKHYFNPVGDFLDYGGGYGILTRNMRDKGVNFFHHDPFSKNLFGFEAKEGQKFELITMIEIFEHLEYPLIEIKKILDTFPSSSILFTTEMQPKELKDWWYFVPEDGQHIGFLSPKTLSYIADKLEMNHYTRGTLHLLTKKKLFNPLKDSLLSIFFQKVGRFFTKLGKLIK